MAGDFPVPDKRTPPGPRVPAPTARKWSGTLPDKYVATLVELVSRQRLTAEVAALAAFHTRHTMSAGFAAVTDHVRARFVAAVLEIARLVCGVDLVDTVHFVVFSGEEQGLWGSSEYAAALAAAGTPVHRLVNLDMIGVPPADGSVTMPTTTAPRTTWAPSTTATSPP